MKKIFARWISVLVAITLVLGFPVMNVSAEEEPYKLLQDFEAYDSQDSIKDSCQNYPYAGEKSLIELNTEVSNSKGGVGNSLKITSSMESSLKENASVSINGLVFEEGYEGFSFWVKNPGNSEIGIFPQFAYGPMPKASCPYEVMADGETEFTEAVATEDQYYNIPIPAGFAGTIRIPFSSFNSPVTSFEPILFITYGKEDPFTKEYTFYVDDIGLYGVAEEEEIIAVAPNNDYEVLDDFEGYDAQAVPSENGYGNYEWGNNDTSMAFVEYNGGKALEVGNAAKSERIDFIKSFKFNPESKGISLFVDNKSGMDLAFNPLINYAQAPVVGRDYFVKAEGAEEYTQVTASGSIYYPLTIEAGFKGEIALPFSVYGEVTTLDNIVFQLWGTTDEYTVVFDDFSLFGVVGGMSASLDNFDSYANDQAVTDGGYGLYQYGSSDSAFELVDDGNGGKALKIMNFKGEPSGGQDNLRIDIQKTYNYIDGAKGLSLHVKNPSEKSVVMSMVINYGYFNQGLTGTHYVKEDGEESFKAGIVSENGYFAIEIPGNFSGVVRLPFEHYTTIADPLICVIQFYADSADYYEIIVDDMELYGIPEQAIAPEDMISAIEVTSKKYGFVPQISGETFSMQLSCKGYNVNNEVRENHSYEFTLENEVKGVTLNESGLLNVTEEAPLGEVKILAKVVYDADGSYGKELAFSMYLSLGESALETVGNKKMPPASSDADYFFFK